MGANGHRRHDLVVIGAREHNLRDVSVTIPRNSLTVITGLSGSGKSSLAFDTIHAEARRRYVESLSSYARQFLQPLERPDVEHIEGLSPSISIEQKTVSHNPRSTVGTVTEIYDHLRVLFSVLGNPKCPECGLTLEKTSTRQIVDLILQSPTGTKVLVMAPIVRGRKGSYRKELAEALHQGYVRAKIDGEMRQLDGEPIELALRKSHDISLVVDRLVISPEDRGRIEAAVDKALERTGGIVSVEVMADLEPKKPAKKSSKKDETAAPSGERVFSTKLSCPDHGAPAVDIAPRLFSFNNRHGACEACDGVGTERTVEEALVVNDATRSLNDGAVALYGVLAAFAGIPPALAGPESSLFREMCTEQGIALDVPWNKLPKSAKTFLLRETWTSSKAKKGKKKSADAPDYLGLLTFLELLLRPAEAASEEDVDEDEEQTRASSGHIPDELLPFYSEQPCSVCNGTRLKAQALAVTIRGKHIADWCKQPVDALQETFRAAEWTERERSIAGAVIQEIDERLGFLLDVGVGYLALDRPARTLAGGEAQRIRLASQLGSRLTGVLYVLDEPSIGLHARDHARLLATLARLRDSGNTVLVVEHDDATMRAADFLIDLGPGAGRLGGQLMAAGPSADVIKTGNSLTARYLRGETEIATPKKRRAIVKDRVVRVVGARANNLKSIDAMFPLGTFICVTGVSGAGKSTLVTDVLLHALGRRLGYAMPFPGAHERIDGHELLDKIVEVDQSPIGRTPRSNVATYTGVLTPIRDLFSNLPESKIRGFQKGRFSFNVSGGRCEACKGDGYKKLEMAFLPTVYQPCDVCHKRRFNEETLQVSYRGKNIADVLESPVIDALEFFQPVPSIRNILQTLHDVGLDYITLGQTAPTLSGGEAQRIKLSRELSKRNTGRTLYVLDEPTTGLHVDDVRKLITALNHLVDDGATVIVIEHHMDVIKSADWIIDLGPDGGALGGHLVAQGTPEEIAANPKSHTGLFLRDVLPKKP